MTRRSSARRFRGLAIPALLIIPALVAAVAPVGAQGLGSSRPSTGRESGRIVGRVIDARTGTGLVGVIVQVADAGIGTLSGVDGRFTLNNVPVGDVALQVESLGFATKVVRGVTVPADGAVEQNVSLEPAAIALAAIEVSAGAERGSVSRALDAQRTATSIVNAITAEQISRSPDGDAAAAMQRVSGVTVQDGKFVFVRGLGERYTTTSLNGARIPSPEPERKVVPLDLFPTGLLQTITTSKTFTPDQSGDFSGAQVDIQTREFPASRTVTYSFAAAANDRVTGKMLPSAPTLGLEWLAFGGSQRSLPGPVRSAGDFTGQITPAAMNGMVASFRNAWSVDNAKALPGGSMGVSVGGTDPVFGHNLSYLLSGTYSISSEVRADEVRAQALAGPNGTTDEIDRFDGTTGRTSVLWGGLFSASSLFGTHTRLQLNATYNRTADNEARLENGTSENFGELPLNIQRLQFVERSVYSSQLKGEHELGERNRVDWSLTASGVSRSEPDRSEIVYATLNDPVTGAPRTPTWFGADNESAVRTFGDLSENGLESAANYRFSFGDPVRQNVLEFGGAFRRTDRDADNRAYSISTNRLGTTDLQLRPEQVFDGRFTSGSDAILRITPLSQGGSYSAADRLAAGYAMLEYGLTDRIRLIGGARVERSSTEVTAQPTIGNPVTTKPEYTDVLPAISLNLRLNDRQNLRLSASQTLARPEYRELAPVQYREVLGGDNVIGNPDLERTLIQNLDARWEWYPQSGEILSIGLFAKNFDSPIERIFLATSGTRVVTFVNATGARNYGAEFELRKRLGFLTETLDAFSLFSNVTVMQSSIRIGSGAASRTSDKRAMVGQAPYVVNAGLTWTSESGRTSATMLYNVVGRRIDSAAEAPLPDVYEEARNVLDLSLRLALTDAFSAKLDAKNLLDEPYQLTQGTVLRESYRSGRSFSLGFSWQRQGS
ncbi:MAG: TonB-dependent receptor [Gemmatimonadota bacterium]|jgi:outer membrane receptor protein involved in Fe transport